MNMLHKTKSGALPDGKPRVYFTCHPDDFAACFDKLCGDIFATHDCAIFYKSDMSAAIDQDDLQDVLGRFNLVVVPVTAKLLTQPNTARDQDLVFAKTNHIPLLPIMMEAGLDSLYSKEENFGERQYLAPKSGDSTEVAYTDKLKNYLNSVLTSDQMASRIRKAFDAYIFLSYRKKDRSYANQLMRLIHSNPLYNSVAIWFDEFLVPGESFKDGIGKMLQDSALFTLLVTPNLLEEPNYVMDTEYPAAREIGKPVLAVEMEDTDRSRLAEKFDGLSDFIRPSDQSFTDRLSRSLSEVALSPSYDPEHNFLLGLAYLEGIDVETDKSKAVELISFAAELGLPEAASKLSDMYKWGIGVEFSYHTAVRWAEKEVELQVKLVGTEHPDYLNAIRNLAGIYNLLGRYNDALKLDEHLYQTYIKLYGEDDENTIIAATNLAVNYATFGNKQKDALDLGQKAYDICLRLFGENNKKTLDALAVIALAEGNLGNDQRALELNCKAYAMFCRLYGKTEIGTLTLLGNVGVNHLNLKHYRHSILCLQRVYELYCQTLGESHPYTAYALNNLATAHWNSGDKEQGLKLFEKATAILSNSLGEEHPHSLKFLSELRSSYENTGDNESFLQYAIKVYDICCRLYGKMDKDTLRARNCLAVAYYKNGKRFKALRMLRKTYPLHKKVFGKYAPDCVLVLENIYSIHKKFGWFVSAAILRGIVKRRKSSIYYHIT